MIAALLILLGVAVLFVGKIEAVAVDRRSKRVSITKRSLLCLASGCVSRSAAAREVGV